MKGWGISYNPVLKFVIHKADQGAPKSGWRTQKFSIKGVRNMALGGDGFLKEGRITK
jgi:hypothetical protein